MNHTQINPSIKFTFASGLRSLLRQDPDIIMVGEVRDEETAKLAVEAETDAKEKQKAEGELAALKAEKVATLKIEPEQKLEPKTEEEVSTASPSQILGY